MLRSMIIFFAYTVRLGISNLEWDSTAVETLQRVPLEIVAPPLEAHFKPLSSQLILL